MSNDLINGLFELGGALLILLNVSALKRDKELRGTHWGPVVFFTAWGFWNLWYYPALNQWLSFAGGCVLVVTNTYWLLMLAYYRSKDNVHRRTSSVGAGQESRGVSH